MPLAPETCMAGSRNAGYSFPDQIVTRFSRNYLKYIEGKPMEGMVNFNLGY